MILSDKAHLKIVGGSHAGVSGKINEDRYRISAYKLEDSTPALFAIVADGIGGHKAGEIAAELAVDMICDEVGKSDASQASEIMRKAIEKASSHIFTQGEQNEDQLGMGTTVACIFVIQNRLYIASVGNSRIYLLRDNFLNQINKDHSWVQEAIDDNLLDPDRARKHPYANVISRYIGGPGIVDVDLRLWLDPSDLDAQALFNQGVELIKGDRLLLCSDGLNDMVYDKDIQEILSSNNIKLAVEKLIDEANQNGGLDNITLVLLEMQ